MNKNLVLMSAVLAGSSSAITSGLQSIYQDGHGCSKTHTNGELNSALDGKPSANQQHTQMNIQEEDLSNLSNKDKSHFDSQSDEEANLEFKKTEINSSHQEDDVFIDDETDNEDDLIAARILASASLSTPSSHEKIKSALIQNNHNKFNLDGANGSSNIASSLYINSTGSSNPWTSSSAANFSNNTLKCDNKSNQLKKTSTFQQQTVTGSFKSTASSSSSTSSASSSCSSSNSSSHQIIDKSSVSHNCLNFNHSGNLKSDNVDKKNQPHSSHKVSLASQYASLPPLPTTSQVAPVMSSSKNSKTNQNDNTFNEQSKIPSLSHTVPKTMTNSPQTQNSNVASTSNLVSFNIEQELIKYTKTLKLNSQSYLEYYKLGEHIRNGGFSEIFEGVSAKSREKVIVKLIPKQKTKNWLMVHNKKYPAEILLHKMSNNIQGVIRMMEFFEEEHEWVIIMPKLTNCMDLFDYLESKHRGRLSEPEACHFFVQLVKINIDLLDHGIVHRDLKSENLLVDLNTMKLILIDFGASAIHRKNTPDHVYTDFHGTRQYKPPEYIKSKAYSAQSSTIWTLGVLLYDMCNGQLPFETEQEIVELNIQVKTQLSDEYKKILFDCLRRDPQLRPTLYQLLDYEWCIVNRNHSNCMVKKRRGNV